MRDVIAKRITSRDELVPQVIAGHASRRTPVNEASRPMFIARLCNQDPRSKVTTRARGEDARIAACAAGGS